MFKNKTIEERKLIKVSIDEKEILKAIAPGYQKIDNVSLIEHLSVGIDKDTGRMGKATIDFLISKPFKSNGVLPLEPRHQKTTTPP